MPSEKYGIVRLKPGESAICPWERGADGKVTNRRSIKVQINKQRQLGKRFDVEPLATGLRVTRIL